MRATILVAALFLVASSAFAATGASQETQVAQGSLEGFGSVGLPQYTASGASKEKQVPQGSLEGFGSVGLPQ